MIEGLAVGRIAHYTLSEGDVPKRPSAVGTDVPAIVVAVWDKESGCANLQVFMDGTNSTGDVTASNMYWATSRKFSEAPTPGCWHWPERV